LKEKKNDMKKYKTKTGHIVFPSFILIMLAHDKRMMYTTLVWES